MWEHMGFGLSGEGPHDEGDDSSGQGGMMNSENMPGMNLLYNQKILTKKNHQDQQQRVLNSGSHVISEVILSLFRKPNQALSRFLFFIGIG